MKIREMTEEDYPQVHDLGARIPGVGLRSLDDSQEGISRFLGRNPNSCFILEEEQQLIGSILSGHDGRRGYIYHAVVDERHRHTGGGKALVKAVIEALRAEGIRKVALVVFRANEAGNGFWDHLGFCTRDDLVYRDLAIIEQ